MRLSLSECKDIASIINNSDGVFNQEKVEYIKTWHPQNMVMLKKRKTIGFCHFGYSPSKVFYINAFIIGAKYQGKGHGDRLFYRSYIRAIELSAHKIKLRCRVDCHSNTFWQKHDFKLYKTQNNFHYYVLNMLEGVV